MGLIYDAGESGALKSALSGNLLTASTALDAVDRASARLVAELGSGELSGRGYAAVETLFAELITPCVTNVRNELRSIQKDLERYTHEDSKVSHFGLLKEDEMNVQLTVTKNQRDATELQMERNRRNAAVATALPGLSEGLELMNRRLELVLAQLESDIRDLEDRLSALRAFSASTRGLFASSLVDIASRIGDVINLLDALNSPVSGVDLLGQGGTAVGAFAQRNKILDFLGGKKIELDAKGRLKAGKNFLFNAESGFLYNRGQRYNADTGARIDYYKQYFKSGLSGARDGVVGDFTGWKSASKFAKAGKIAGVAGLGLSVALNVNQYFGDGRVDEYDAQDFAVDTGVDLLNTAVAAGVGAAVGSAFVPPVGTVIGAGVGIFVSLVFGSAADSAKDTIKNSYR
ncbi:hypothetical protein ASF88_03765 [Leifsonia sp. Leaf336]|uniref:hypothetical protein n=1 Tax=Leifsonia sp. Leaf336 TaxID=1736341 RepID=UPI000701B2B1|nr:hypothetical protein [Leifsonia sp. Leaf336]KQR53968.1 hypothetical protein ASF88_03765 [Leifsonia sp. Leaf336]